MSKEIKIYIDNKEFKFLTSVITISLVQLAHADFALSSWTIMIK